MAFSFLLSLECGLGEGTSRILTSVMLVGRKPPSLRNGILPELRVVGVGLGVVVELGEVMGVQLRAGRRLTAAHGSELDVPSEQP